MSVLHQVAVILMATLSSTWISGSSGFQSTGLVDRGIDNAIGRRIHVDNSRWREQLRRQRQQEARPTSCPTSRAAAQLPARKRSDDGYYDDDEEEGRDDDYFESRGLFYRGRRGDGDGRRNSNEDDDWVEDGYYYRYGGDGPRDRRGVGGGGRRRDDGYDGETEEDYLGEFAQSSGLGVPSSFGRRDGWRLPDSVSKALLAGVFVLGVGLGVTIDSQVNTNPRDLASRDAIDNAAPNPTLCAKLGASAMAFDQRVFVSFNPFNVYVSQADVKPACVLREANVVPVLRAKGLIDDEAVRSCKRNMNTWAFVGNLEDRPQLSCVYKSHDAQNEFLSNPKIGLGEDYLDDGTIKATGKLVKGGMTDAQKDLLRKQANVMPGADL